MANKVNIEVMIDTNANSRRIDREFKQVRDDVAGQDEAGASRVLREFGSYLRGVRSLTGIDYEVTQRDTAQIFHEKTNTLTPELAEKAGIRLTPDFLRENLRSGFYRVEPPIHGEEVYYAALRRMVYMIQEDKAPGLLKSQGIVRPEDIDPLRLQALYRQHMMNLPQNSRYRMKAPFRKEFERYHEVRFNQGEETAIHFLRAHPLPQEDERTAFVFVGSDHYANDSMAIARKGMEIRDKGRMEVFVARPDQFRQMLVQVIRSIEEEHPECRKLRQGMQDLRYIDGDFPLAPTLGTASWADSMDDAGKERPAMDKARSYRVPDGQVSAFADFVTRVDGKRENMQNSQGR